MYKKLICTIIITVFSAFRISAQVLDVWAISDGEKVFKYHTDHFAKRANSIWNGRLIKLKGLYNEVIGFQIIVELGHEGSRALEIAMAPPIHKATGHTIGGDACILYGPQGSIELFSQHYLHVTRPTKPAWYYGSEASAPIHMTGWIPDALIPDDAHGIGGFPLIVPPTKEEVIRNQNELYVIERKSKQNQGFWIDLYLPSDSSYPAGLYESEITIWSNGKVVRSIPVEIRLLNGRMPDENHSNVWLYSSRGKSLQYYFPGFSMDQINKMIKFEAHRHRIDLVGGFEVNQQPFDALKMKAYKPYLDGTAFTPANGYHGPGIGYGEKLFAIGIYGEPALGSTKESILSEADKWVNWFEKNAPHTRFFWYMIDEPGPVQYPWIKQNAAWLKSSDQPGSRLPVFITTSYKKELEGAVDIWCGYRGIEDPGQFNKLKKEGKDHWFYNGHRPFFGSFILEAEAVDLRVNCWIKYLYGINTWFIWHGTHWRHNQQGPKGRLHQRVFNEPLTFINWNFNYGNGDGILFYPGRMAHQPEEDRGLNRVLPSIRLKNIRRGQQDYELMWLAEQKIGREKVLQLIRKVIPKAMYEVQAADPVAWSQRGDDYDKIRDLLLDIIINN